jgi:hypothetical protein
MKILNFFFKKDPIISFENNETEIVNLLDNLIELLLQNNSLSQVEFLKSFKTNIIDKNLTEINQKYNSTEFWGGSGALWEVGFESEKTQVVFNKYLYKLICILENCNLRSKGSKSVKRILKNWNT